MGNHQAPVPEPPEDYPLALRMTFSYHGREIELAAVQRVALWVPPSDSLDDRRDRSGFWLEFRDAAGVPVFRQDLPPTVGDDYEVFPEDPAGEIIRQPVDMRSGAFSIVVPEMSEARQLTFVGSPSAAQNRSEAARDLATFDFAELLRRLEPQA